MRMCKLRAMLLIIGTFCFLPSVRAQLPQLSLESLADYREAIEPTADESAFLDINWYSQLGEAVREAHKSEKPLLIYVMNGHPLGCT